MQWMKNSKGLARFSNKSTSCHTNLVQQSTGISNRQTYNNKEQISDVTFYPKSKLVAVLCCRITQKQLGEKERNNIINAAWRNSTQGKCKYIFKRWEEFCSVKGISKVQANTNDLLIFLTREYERGLLYKALINVISALSNRMSYSVRHHTIGKFLKSIFNLRPPKKQIPFNLECWWIITIFAVDRNWKEYGHKPKASRIESSFTFDEVSKHSCPNYC